MRSQKFALTSDGPKRLEVKWDGGWCRIRRNIRFIMDENVITTVPTREELEKGCCFNLGDGSVLEAKLKGNMTLEISYNDQLLSKIFHPKEALKSFSEVLFFAGGLGLVDVLISIFDSRYADKSFISIVLTINSVLCILFGFLVRKFQTSLITTAVAAILPISLLVLVQVIDRFSLSLLVTLIAYIFLAVAGIKATLNMRKQI
jgi:hypothetical protein